MNNISTVTPVFLLCLIAGIERNSLLYSAVVSPTATCSIIIVPATHCDARRMIWLQGCVSAGLVSGLSMCGVLHALRNYMSEVNVQINLNIINVLCTVKACMLPWFKVFCRPGYTCLLLALIVAASVPWSHQSLEFWFPATCPLTLVPICPGSCYPVTGTCLRMTTSLMWCSVPMCACVLEQMICQEYKVMCIQHGTKDTPAQDQEVAAYHLLPHSISWALYWVWRPSRMKVASQNLWAIDALVFTSFWLSSFGSGVMAATRSQWTRWQNLMRIQLWGDLTVSEASTSICAFCHPDLLLKSCH